MTEVNRSKTQHAHLDMTLVLPDGEPSGLTLKPVVTGFHVPQGTARHRFVPSLAFPGRDECGYVMGWMTACGLPKTDVNHRRRTGREVKGESIIKAAAEGRAQIAYLEIPGLNAPADKN